MFDMDGVISCSVVPMTAEGEAQRTLNIKDGYALQYAAKQGYVLAIISGGESPAMRERARYLGIPYVYMRVRSKLNCLKDLLDATGLNPEQLIYVGDDIPDLEIMQAVGLPVAPQDAVPEVKAVAGYISRYAGGQGVVRDVIEQTLKAQGRWANGEGWGW
ncbi:3-deoxy-D-manno-octulosonate 8-phosphate phosphatase [Porphyromonas crevioricanis JCM 15906]|uniref:3-deoxy-D-manno-octulosonate 8-phosphate phosphatase n=1 Tax=Porphyromonas crevioricanis JCM 15906 TaxID=1305617 RepID=T1DT97_9PORP|nr:3-deoxy-D-manno-octulosonate 8-phosphate phosphatase [Porphyromonas crevioricanis JCM 15906]GAD07859.1 3-deoxy-D-manno-octulosonate 8-phosphate phosphatase [Porphyromonas crevioricanis JCM 13913]